MPGLLFQLNAGKKIKKRYLTPKIFRYDKMIDERRVGFWDKGRGGDWVWSRLWEEAAAALKGKGWAAAKG